MPIIREPRLHITHGFGQPLANYSYESVETRVGEGFTTDILSEPYLISLWRMNEFSGQMHDESGYKNHATINSLTRARPLISGDVASAYFDGASSLLSVPMSDRYMFGRSTFVVEFWTDAKEGTIIEHPGAWSIWVEDGSLYASITDRLNNMAAGSLYDQMGLAGGDILPAYLPITFDTEDPATMFRMATASNTTMPFALPATFNTDAVEPEPMEPETRASKFHIAVVFDRSTDSIYAYVNGMVVENMVSMEGIRSILSLDDLTIGSGSHGFLEGSVGELAIISSNVPIEAIQRRFRTRSRAYSIYDTVEELQPYAHYVVDDGVFIDTEISTFTPDGLVAYPSSSRSWDKRRDGMKVNAGGVDVDPFPVETIEFVASPNSTVPELIYRHTYDTGEPLSIYLAGGVVRIEEGGVSREYNFTTNAVHVAVRMDDATSVYFVNGKQRAFIDVPARGEVTGIRLFSLDQNPYFTGYIDYIALYDSMLENRQIHYNSALVRSGRNHIRLYDTSPVNVADEGYRAFYHDWRVSSA